MADRYASLKQGLVGAWIPSISGSGLLLPDLSGRGNNGALTNMGPEDWVSSQYGRALDFDGSNDRVESRAISYQSLPLTVAGWVKSNTVSGVQMLASHYGVEGNRAWYLALINNAVRILVSPDGTLIPYGQGGTVTTDWTHVIGVVGPSAFQIYLNGIAVSTTLTGTYPTQIFNSTANIVLGDRATTDTPLNGQLDDIRLYSRALSEPEIRLLASEPGIGFKPAKKLSRFSTRYTYKPPKAKVFEGVRVRDHDYASLREGLVGAWCPSLPNGGSGNTLPDQSGRGNHGTLTNMGPEDWVSSGDGRALDFDNTDDYVSCSSQAVQSLTSGTICFWLKTSKEVCAPFCIQQATSVNDSFQIGIGQNWTGFLTNELITVARVGSGSINRLFGYTTETRTELLDNQWHHVAIVASGSYAIYIDGVSKSLTFPGAYPTNDGAFTSGIASLSSLYIGGYRDGVDILPINGQMDDVRVYSRGLSESEIRLLASRPGIGLQPSPTRLIAREKKTGLRRKILTGQT